MSLSARHLLRRLITNRFITKVLWPVLVTLPPMALTFTQVKGYPSLAPYQKVILDWFVGHPLYIPLCFLWTVVLLGLNYVFGPLVDKARETPDRMGLKELALLLKCFGETVGAKLETSGCFLRSLQQRRNPVPLTSPQWFSELHDPEAQIRLLVDNLYQVFFTDLKEQDGELKIALAQMNGSEIQNFKFCAPRDHLPISSASQINSTKNGFLAAFMAKKMLIISDLAKESRRGDRRRYTALGDDPSPPGSMICYPIQHPHLGSIPFVLSIKCNLRNHFTEEARNRYELLIHYFAHRILLEYTLAEIQQLIV